MKQFFHYNDGVVINDSQINEWLNEVRLGLLNGHGKATISSGDCSVLGIEWKTEFEFFVANSSGKSVIRFSKQDEFEEMKNYEFKYRRPISKVEC